MERSPIAITVHRNGDATTKGRRFILPSNRLLTWENILQQIGSKFDDRPLYIRRLATPRGRTTISNAADLANNQQYVAVAAGERFQYLDVFRNGDPFTPAVQIHLNPLQLMDMELVFRAIEERVFLTDYRAIRRLYTQKGERIRSPNQIEDKLDIVAAGREPFRPTAYGSPLPRLSVSPSRKITKYADVEFLNILPIVQHHLLHCAHGHCSRDYQGGNCQRNQEMNVTSNAGQAGHHFVNDPNSAATLIQAQYRGYRTRKTLAGIHQQAVEGSEGDTSHRHHFAGDRDSAATLIQAKYRGYRTRKSLAAMQHPQAAKASDTEASHGHHFLGDRDSAATLIQASYRGYRTRKSLGFRPSRASEENQAEGYQKMSPELQTRPHGYNTRTHQAKGLKDISNQSAMGDDKRPTEDDLNRAATTIQASFRGYHVRRELQKHESKHAHQSSGKQQVIAPSPDELEAAKKIQAAFRGYRVRKQFRSQTTPISSVSSGNTDLDDSKYVAAATKIQASYRGYRTRKSSNFHRSSLAPIARSAKN